MSNLNVYIIEAVYTWIDNNDLTPLVLINSRTNYIKLPHDFADCDGKVLINLSRKAIMDIQFYEKRIKFVATFNKKKTCVIIPIESILELYSHESKQGLFSYQYGYIINVKQRYI
jgi:stringent starvation protein B